LVFGKGWDVKRPCGHDCGEAGFTEIGVGGGYGKISFSNTRRSRAGLPLKVISEAEFELIASESFLAVAIVQLGLVGESMAELGREP
jgi:hypothetical protein